MKKYYINSNGEQIPIEEIHTEHLINGYAKKYRDIFTVEDKDEFAKRTQELKDIQEEMYKRLNIFYETLGGNDANTK